jgi:methionine synthase I (cobalamin-dependent)/5,10-methylenetetrahydrofolate reductase
MQVAADTKKDFLVALKNNRPLVADGAMGTMLHSRGIGINECFDELNLTNPALVAEIHRDYINAGAQIIQTNTFGANRFKLEKHGLEDKLVEINTAGVDLARRSVLASFKEVWIAGDVGPLGIHLAPFGKVQPEQARQIFIEQINALQKAGADLIAIETISDTLEACEAVRAARQVCSLPVMASMTFTRDDRTILGDEPVKVARLLKESGVDVIGVNCSGGPAQILRILKKMRQAFPDAFYLVKPNAGWPEQIAGRIMYPAAPEYFGDYALAFWQAGAKIIGGCCGTTPQHIAAIRQIVDLTRPEQVVSAQIIPQPEISETLPAADQPTQLAQKLSAGEFVMAVEMDPPRGLSMHKLLAGASLLAEAGVDVIDVADSPMARMRMSPWAVCSLVQRQVGVETVLHFPTRGRNLLRVQGDLLAAHALGVRNIFVVMGDPTAIGDYPEAMDNYDLVPSGLIKLIKQGFNAGMDHAGSNIGQPTSFFVGCALNLDTPDYAQEVKNLQRKLKAGADFALTQPIFNLEVLDNFLNRYESDFGPLPIPVLVGILPLYNSRHAAFLHHEVPGITIPEATRQRIDQAGENSAREGIRIAIELTQQIRSRVGGIYLMPAFNRYDIAAEIVEAVKQPSEVSDASRH